MANMAGKHNRPDYPHTILMMVPEGGEPTFELAQYGSHNQAMLDPQTEPRLDLYQVKNDGFEGRYDPNKRTTMRNTGFTPPSQRAMNRINKVGETQPMLDEHGSQIGKVVQFSAAVDVDNNGYTTGINERSIAPADTSRGKLPRGVNLLQDIAKRANNDYQDQYLTWERTGQGRPPRSQGQPGVDDHLVVSTANRATGPFTSGPPTPAHWARYATDNPTQARDNPGGFSSPNGPSTAAKAQHYLDTARPETGIESDTAASREKAAASFGAHNPVKSTTRNLGWDTTYDTSGRQTTRYNPAANRGVGPAGFGAPANNTPGSYDYQSTGMGFDHLPQGVNRESALGHELGTHQETQQHKFQQEMRRRSEPRSAKLKRMFDNSMGAIQDAGRKMMGKDTPQVTTPEPAPPTYRDGPFGRVTESQHPGYVDSNAPGPFGAGSSHPGSRPGFGEGSLRHERSAFGAGDGHRPQFGEGAGSQPKSNPFTSAMDAQREQTTSMDTQNVHGVPVNPRNSGFTPRPSSFGQQPTDKDTGPSFG